MEYLKLCILICLVSEAIQGGVHLGSISDEILVPSPRIVTGKIAATGQFPYQVSVRVGGQHTCGGTILNQEYIITAAHCVYSLLPEFVTVQAGTVNRTEEDGVILGVTSIIPHPDFNYYESDIALLKLNSSLEYSDIIQPISLAAVSPPDNVAVTISGWGRVREGGPLSETLLYNRNLKTLRIDDCNTAIGYTSPGVLCLSKASGNGICEGDEGGPAVYRGILIGIASYHTSACGTREPDGYTKISEFREWLLDNAIVCQAPS